jgi:hypothetical protein
MEEVRQLQARSLKWGGVQRTESRHLALFWLSLEPTAPLNLQHAPKDVIFGMHCSHVQVCWEGV